MTEERDCRKCSKLGLSKGCVGKEFYSYSDIRFCRFQMIWLIEHIGELSEDKWPGSPDSSSYVDMPITKKQFRDEAYFVKPRVILADIMIRLDRTGEDGVTLMEEIHSGLHEYSLLSRAARNALNYISINDWRKRKTSYGQWKASRNYYKNIAKGRKLDRV